MGESYGLAYGATGIGFSTGNIFGELTLLGEALEYFGNDINKVITQNNVDILNMSWGPYIYSRSDLSILYSPDTTYLPSEILLAGFLTNLSNLAASGIFEGDRIFVWAAGNGNQSNPSLLASLPSIVEQYITIPKDLAWIAVVGTDRGGRIADGSDRCGIAYERCIAAPGWGVQAAFWGDDTWTGSEYLWGEYKPLNGTSFAAPMVSGGLAIMKSMFRDQLSNYELVQRLFSTANDDGIYANSAIYGHGLMDLGAATNPWGVPEFMSTLPGTGSATITSTFMALGAPLGDGLTQALASQEIAAFDALGAPFWFQVSDFTVPSSGASVAARLQRFLNPIQLRSLPDVWQFNLQENTSATETGHLALTDGASRFSMDGPQGLAATVFQKPGDVEGLTLAWTPMAFSALTLEAGYLNEQQSLLGSQAKGAFGHLSGDTLFLGAGVNTTAGRWQLAAQGEIGQVNPSLGHSQLIDAVSSLSTSAFHLQATRPFVKGSTLSFSLSQPLRVESGSLTFSLPTGRTQDGVVLHQALSAPLAPSGRQLDLTTALDMPLGEGELSLGFTMSNQPRHQKGAGTEYAVFTGYRAIW